MAGIEVLGEGYDEKSVGYVTMARPTMSEALSRQSVGRGLTRGEAGHLIGECDRLDERYPTPATLAGCSGLASRLTGASSRLSTTSTVSVACGQSANTGPPGRWGTRLRGN